MSYGDELISNLLEKQCCACGGIIKKHGKSVNMVGLDRHATWEYPTMGNIITKQKERAVAIVCDHCTANHTPIQYAVQLENGKITYIPVSTLKKIESQSF